MQCLEWTDGDKIESDVSTSIPIGWARDSRGMKQLVNRKSIQDGSLTVLVGMLDKREYGVDSNAVVAEFNPTNLSLPTGSPWS